MAQFDVHRNRGANRDAIPYVVVVHRPSSMDTSAASLFRW